MTVIVSIKMNILVKGIIFLVTTLVGTASAIFSRSFSLSRTNVLSTRFKLGFNNFDRQLNQSKIKYYQPIKNCFFNCKPYPKYRLRFFIQISMAQCRSWDSVVDYVACICTSFSSHLSAMSRICISYITLQYHHFFSHPNCFAFDVR